MKEKLTAKKHKTTKKFYKKQNPKKIDASATGETAKEHEKHLHEDPLQRLFSAKSIAIIGASRSPDKVGHVILKNLIDGGFRGFLYPVNPNSQEILGIKSYRNVLAIEDPIDLAVIAVQPDIAIKAAEECGKKGIKNLIIVTAGFKEEGFFEKDKKLHDVLEKYGIKAIGPNCLGVYDAYTKLDTLFLPRYRLQRPKEGGISFISQSGAIGSAILDYATEKGYNFSKFVSYGNAMNIDETDLLEYLGKDEQTKVICMYVEGLNNGRRFIDVAREVAKKKPIIVLKGGKTYQGAKAAVSHTGALAGEAVLYSSIFRQLNIIEADTLEEVFEYAKMFEKLGAHKVCKGNNIQIITNGGGYGIIATDAAVSQGLHLSELSAESKKIIRKMDLKTENPLDLLGDANNEGYIKALEIANKDKSVDMIAVIILYQTPLVTTDMVNILTEFNASTSKPMTVISTGGEFTELLSKRLEEQGVAVYSFPLNAVKAMAKMMQYYKRRDKI